MIGRARRLLRSADPQAGDGVQHLSAWSGSVSGASSIIHHPSDRASFLHALRRRSSRPCSGASSVLRSSSNSSPVPRQLRLLAFLPRSGIAAATAGQTRSPRFRRDPFVRDVAFDPGRASAPRMTAPAHVAFDVNHSLGPCDVKDFVAQSHTPHDCYVLALAVAGDDATLASGRALPLTRTGLPPAGSRQLRLAHEWNLFKPLRQFRQLSPAARGVCRFRRRPCRLPCGLSSRGFRVDRWLR